MKRFKTSLILGLVAIGLQSSAQAEPQRWKKILSCENDAFVVDVDEADQESFQVVVRNQAAVTYFGRGANDRGELIHQGLSAYEKFQRSFFEPYSISPVGERLRGIESLLEGEGWKVAAFHRFLVSLTFPGGDEAVLSLGGYSNSEMAGPDRFWRFYDCRRF